MQFLINRIERIESSYKKEMLQPKELKKAGRNHLKGHVPETFDFRFIKFLKRRSLLAPFAPTAPQAYLWKDNMEIGIARIVEQRIKMLTSKQ